MAEESGSAAGARDPKNWVPWIVGGLILVAFLAAYFLLFGPSATEVPDVTGKTLEEAEKAISDAGFAVGSVENTQTSDAESGTVVAQDPKSGVEADRGSRVNLVVAEGSSLVEVPDVSGKTEDEAKKELEAAGLRVVSSTHYSDDVEKGLVADQLPEGGSKVSPDTQIGILVSLGPSPDKDTVKVPDVTGKTEKDAIKTLNDAGLKVRTYYNHDASVPSGSVAGQLPEGGDEVPISTTVAILVSSGSKPTPPTPTTAKVPDVTGKSEADAKKALTDAGLNSESVPVFSDDVAEGNVVDQYPTSGTEVLLGSDVAIAVSQGPEQGDTADVPDVSGMTGAKAAAAIEAVGLKTVMLSSPTPEGTAADTVIAQLPAAGTTVPTGSPVVVLTANGETGDLDPEPAK